MSDEPKTMKLTGPPMPPELVKLLEAVLGGICDNVNGAVVTKPGELQVSYTYASREYTATLLLMQIVEIRNEAPTGVCIASPSPSGQVH